MASTDVCLGRSIAAKRKDWTPSRRAGWMEKTPPLVDALPTSTPRSVQLSRASTACLWMVVSMPLGLHTSTTSPNPPLQGFLALLPLA